MLNDQYKNVHKNVGACVLVHEMLKHYDTFFFLLEKKIYGLLKVDI